MDVAYAVYEAVYLCIDSASLSARGSDSAHTDGQRMVLKIYETLLGSRNNGSRNDNGLKDAAPSTQVSATLTQKPRS